MHYIAVIKSVPLRYACVFLLLQFVYTCLKLNKLSGSTDRGQDSYVHVFEAAEVFRLALILLLGGLFVVINYSQRDARIGWAVFLLFLGVWAVFDCVVIGLFLVGLASMAQDLTASVFVISVVNVLEPLCLWLLYRWMVRKGKLKIEWGAAPKLNEFTDPIQKFVYMHLPHLPPAPHPALIV